MAKNYAFGNSQGFLVSLTKILVGIIGVLSFGKCCPAWDTDLIGYFLVKYIDKYTKDVL